MTLAVYRRMYAIRSYLFPFAYSLLPFAYCLTSIGQAYSFTVISTTAMMAMASPR